MAQNIAEEAGVGSPSTVIGNDNTEVQRILALLNNEGRWLVNFTDWRVLNKVYSITTVNGTASYALPADFDHFIPVTQWNRTLTNPVQGPASPQEWQERKSGIIRVSAFEQTFRLKPVSGVNRVFIDPTPTAVYNINVEYISKHWVDTTAGFADSFVADTDTPLFDESLVEMGALWRYLQRIGVAFQEELADYEAALNEYASRDGGANVLDMSGRTVKHMIQEGNFPS